ncbi:2-oxo acid dehydrogenase subunit E2 [Amycolatopsis pithecellobii]|nr:2-oxo acid dehydrogenase subunit E2 [Amycolatopsis pithecellobii]
MRVYLVLHARATPGNRARSRWPRKHRALVAQLERGGPARRRYCPGGRNRRGTNDHGPRRHATALALRIFPRMNASAVDDAVLLHRQVSIGVATETPDGLVVPVVAWTARRSPFPTSLG